MILKVFKGFGGDLEGIWGVLRDFGRFWKALGGFGGF